MIDARWEGYSHEEIYRLVHTGPGAAASSAARSLWADAQKLIQSTDQRIADAVKQAAGGWEGAAAEATRAAMSPLQSWALDATGDATLTASAVDAQAAQAMNVRNTMPEPQTGRTWGMYDPGDTPWLVTDVAAAEEREANNHARAVELMNAYMSTSFENRGHMDYWTLPPSITIETASAPAASPGPTAIPAGAAPVPPSGADWTPPASSPANPPAPTNAPPIGAATPAPGSAIPAPVVPGIVPGSAAPATARPPVPGGNPVEARPVTAPPGTTVPPPFAARPGAIAAPGVRPASPQGRPVAPAPLRGAPTPSWRDVVPGHEPTPVERSTPRSEPPRPPAARSGSALQPGLYPPMIASGAGSEGREHRRPDYLIEDADVFTDDRWFTPPVIDGEEAR